MAIETWWLYLAACAGLSLTPGPNGLLALTHGALHGVRRTVFTILGGALGFTAVIALSLFGIGALLAASADLLFWLKLAGGAYLVYLGIVVWRSPPIQVSAASGARPAHPFGLFAQGLLAATTNPKGILFFVAFLPQFLDPTASLLAQFAVMAATFVAVEIVFELVVARASQSVQPWLARVGRTFNRVTGGVFVGIGVLLPLQR
ncbi:LysE family translocator [Microcella sp.]|uniref:LysE family translocator n=1 Tax=Microcella sp. TaxID=1913979 RepID=UPI003919E898